MAALTEDRLYGRWVHSHEEDTAGGMVFRPATHRFPPSRGRAAFELRQDGTYLESSPGPVDLPVESEGRWALTGDRLVLGAAGDRPARAWRVTAVEAGRLTVTR